MASQFRNRPAAPSLEVEIMGRHRKAALGPVEFELSVAAPGRKSWVVRRRYSCFRELDSTLRHMYPLLPTIPPKSRFRKWLLASFMEDREQRLGEWLRALLAADPHATGDELRRFLGFLGDFEPLTEEGDEQEEVSRPPLRRTGQTRPAVSTTMPDSVGPDAQPPETCGETLFRTLAPRGVRLSVISEGDGYYEVDLDDSTENLLAVAIARLRIENAQLEAENVAINSEIKAAVLDAECRCAASCAKRALGSA